MARRSSGPNHERREGPAPFPSLLPRVPLIQLEDRRAFSPSGRAPLRSIHREIFQTLQRTRSTRGAARTAPLSPMLENTFDDPQRVIVCLRRKARKEVLHALKKTGGRGGRKKKPRRTWQSDFKCRS